MSLSAVDMCVTSAELADPEQAWLTWSQLAASPEVLCTPQAAGSTPALFFFFNGLMSLSDWSFRK